MDDEPQNKGYKIREMCLLMMVWSLPQIEPSCVSSFRKPLDEIFLRRGRQKCSADLMCVIFLYYSLCCKDYCWCKDRWCFQVSAMQLIFSQEIIAAAKYLFRMKYSFNSIRSLCCWWSRWGYRSFSLTGIATYNFQNFVFLHWIYILNSLHLKG